jgi:purine-binding chemotaxis protein CheW
MKKEYLSFILNNSLYGIDVRHVEEVLVYTPPVRIPCAATCIEGLINSRGQGILMVNLRKRFLLPDIEPVKTTRIIVVEIKVPVPEDPDHINIFGAVADDVREVIELDDEDLKPVPRFGNTVSSEFISAIGKKDDKFIILINADRVFTDCTQDLCADTNKIPSV